MNPAGIPTRAELRHHSRRGMLIGFAAGLVFAVVLSTIIEGFKKSRHSGEHGFPFPNVGSITRIEARYGMAGQQARFDVPAANWPALLAALSPSRFDDNAMKWLVIGDLKIHLIGGESISVDLYDPHESEGAFSAGPSFETRTDYRGGSTAALKSVLDDAQRSAPTAKAEN